MRKKYSYSTYDVICNNCRVTWIIFWNSCFKFSNKVSPYVSPFSENTATKTSKNRDKRSTKT